MMGDFPAPDAASLSGSQIARSTAWAALGALLRYVLAGITTLILARLLTPREIGLFAITLLAGELVSHIAIAGFHDAIIQRDVHLDSAYLNTAFWSALLAAGALVGLVLALTGPVAALFDQPDLGPLLAAMAFAGLLRAAGTVPRALLAQRMDFAGSRPCRWDGAGRLCRSRRRSAGRRRWELDRSCSGREWRRHPHRLACCRLAARATDLPGAPAWALGVRVERVVIRDSRAGHQPRR